MEQWRSSTNNGAHCRSERQLNLQVETWCTYVRQHSNLVQLSYETAARNLESCQVLNDCRRAEALRPDPRKGGFM